MFYLHLEKIEMTGFKSFADKTVIEFDKGVTAVVGPNGSGKSNLAEAVRWVLGEQSAKNLRGKKMNDVVFAGSQSRKPVNIAEVTLVFNNEDGSLPLDFSQISMTRRINRNGESVCFINKKPCRLKDITDLLMDSGIGKDSFSMISQGKVEQIFQNKPEERRSIFEDAAGIAKYKNRKISAERKLNETQDHLNRVEDILHEISGQLVPLEVQRNTALLFQKKKKELSEIEIALISVEIATLNEQWQQSKKDILHYEAEIKMLEDQQREIQDTLSALKQQGFERDEELETLQEHYVSLVQELEKLEGKKNILEQRADFSEKNKQEQEETIQQKLQLIQSEKSQLKKMQKQAKEKAVAKGKFQTQIQTLQEKERQLSIDQNEWIQQLRDRYIEKLQKQSTNKNTLLHLQKEEEQLRERVASAAQNFSEVEKQIEKATETMENQAKELEAHQHIIEENEQKLYKKDKELAGIEEKERQLNNELLSLSRALQQAEARKESQQELEDSYASYYQGVKEILKRRQALPGIHGPVGELFHVSDEYSVAMETALGGAIQHIVVENPAAASKCIAVLKSTRSGRATFLPLSVIQGKALPAYIQHEIEHIAGFIGVGSELIAYEDRYRFIAQNLLGTTIVSRDLESGLVIAKKVQNRYRIVSLEGDIIHAGGSMSGGATKKQQTGSVFSRKNSIEKLTVFLQEKTAAYQFMEQKIQSLQRRIQLGRREREQFQQAKNESRYQLEKLLDLQQREEQKLADLVEERTAVQYGQKNASRSLSEVESQQIEEKKLQSSLAEEIESLKRQMEASTLNEEERVHLLQSIQKELQQTEQQLAVLLEQEKQLRRDIQSTRKIIETENMTVQAIQEKLQEAEQLAITEYDTIEEVSQSIAVGNLQKEEAQDTLKKKRKEKGEIETQIERKNQELQETARILKLNWTEQTKVESRSSRFEVAIDHHLHRLSEEYGLNFEAARENYSLSISIEEATALVRRLKKEIEQLGPVNLAAVEEYERILERFEFLSEQQEDLLSAKNTLLHTMEEMDEEVSSRFEQKFLQIKKQFERTFPKLFGGGKATIELTDSGNLLETGIEIIAQPPGKKLQQLSLLSGGEKAFTAIALLFSIIEVSPVPFCILDEVEAALDEANVSRFGKYLASFENKTQFIVITHRKGTMEEADVLYGVTMQDSGVSRLASIRFENQAETM